jgi:hypothetical protein
MSNEATQNTDSETTENPLNGLPEGDMFGGIEKFLSKLIPPDSLEIQTFDGKLFTLPGAIPARRQVVVFRMLKELLDEPEITAALAGMGGPSAVKQNIQATNVVDVLIGLCTSEKLLEKLGGIFSCAYPEVIEVVGDPLDAFALEDLVQSLLPFSERFLKKVGGGLATLGRVAEEVS